MTINDNTPQPEEYPEQPTLRLSPLISKEVLKERIETKIEEYRECGYSTIDFDAGLIAGLEAALLILEES